MAFDSEKRLYSKEHIWYIEIEIDGTTYRFCENRSPVPRQLEANPSLQSVRVNPAEIDIEGGIGVRAKCSVTLMESDDYTYWGTIANPVRFWSRWRAEHPYYLGARLSVFSGYINNGLWQADNFVKRDYIIESFAMTAAGVSITGKDPLKLASNDRAKAPVESRGSLLSNILSTETSFDLQPTGIGDAEYPASNFYIRVGDEVMLCTSRTGDTLTVTRGQFNTAADDHSEDDNVQLCLYYENLKPWEIDYDLLVTYANVPTSYINAAVWESENDNAFITTYSALITEPTGVQKLLKEFAQSAPHSMYWDERINEIKWKAIKPPPTDAPRYDWQGNFIEGSTGVKDMQDMRIGSVVINYGIIDPTKDLEEPTNYRNTYVRADISEITLNGGQNPRKTVYSRWIENDNKTAAVLMAARVGRRFAKAPRMFSFSMDAKDSDVWSGDDVILTSDLIQQSGGGYPAINYQIISAGETQNYNYTALEHTYGASLPEDEDVEDPNVRLIYISGLQDRLIDQDGGGTTPRSLRDYFADVFPADHAALDPNLDIRFIFESNCVAGSADSAAYAVTTGAWPELLTPILVINQGLIVGKGGDGGTWNSNGTDGGPALQLQANIRLNNLNIIGGGGGGGGGGRTTEGTTFVYAGGAGGAGYTIGQGASSYVTPTVRTVSAVDGENGTYTQGGERGTAVGITTEATYVNAFGGDGGSLGQDGNDVLFDGSLGGSAGKAIDLNGFTITYVNTGTIEGDVS